jgi:hypothetical protein
MTINQLFSQKPDEVMISKILECFGLASLEDTKIFTKKDLKETQVLENIDKIKDEISAYYLPCKRAQYLENLNFKKSITLLRQFIKCYDYTCYSKEKYIQGEKYLTYQLMSLDKKNVLKMRKKDDSMIVSFD